MSEHVVEDLAAVRRAVAAWLENVVIDLGLCPFAALPWRQGRVHMALSYASTPQEALDDVIAELGDLVALDQGVRGTSLVVLPRLALGFEDFLDFCAAAEAALSPLGLEGVVQIVPFHPQFLFAQEPEEGVSHYTNRSPYPLLHLLREEDVSRALAQYPNPRDIYQRNRRTLEALGHEELERRRRGRG
ncbi:MAG: DUF1415 domain-containing protein [Candidatus Competibacterales bacterium]